MRKGGRPDYPQSNFFQGRSLVSALGDVGFDTGRAGYRIRGGSGLAANDVDLRSLIRNPGLHRLCPVGNASTEWKNRTANFKKCVARTADVHPFLRRSLDDMWVGLCSSGERCRVPDDVWLAGFSAVPAHRRLRSCRSDSRALQDSFFMRSTTRQVPRVL